MGTTTDILELIAELPLEERENLIDKATEQMLEDIAEDKELGDLVLSRRNQRNQAIRVNLDEL